MVESIYHSQSIYNSLRKLNLSEVYPHKFTKHMVAIIISMFTIGYRGKATAITALHCPFSEPWKMERKRIGRDIESGSDSDYLWGNRKKREAGAVYSERHDCLKNKAFGTGFASDGRCIFYFHDSHLKRKKNYRHQAMSVMQRAHAELCDNPLRQIQVQNPDDMRHCGRTPYTPRCVAFPLRQLLYKRSRRAQGGWKTPSCCLPTILLVYGSIKIIATFNIMDGLFCSVEFRGEDW